MARGGNGAVQFKLVVGARGDPFEREADTTVDRVTSGGAAPQITSLGPGAISRMAAVQREALDEEEERPAGDEIVQPCASCEEEAEGAVQPLAVQRQAADEEVTEQTDQADTEAAPEQEIVQPCQNCGEEGREAVQAAPAGGPAAVGGGPAAAPATSPGNGISPRDQQSGCAGAPLAPAVRSRLEPGLSAGLGDMYASIPTPRPIERPAR